MAYCVLIAAVSCKKRQVLKCDKTTSEQTCGTALQKLVS
jgi:hypothetical protein